MKEGLRYVNNTFVEKGRSGFVFNFRLRFQLRPTRRLTGRHRGTKAQSEREELGFEILGTEGQRTKATGALKEMPLGCCQERLFWFEM